MSNTPNRWAIRESGIATFYKPSTGEAIVTLKTLKMSEVQTSGETTYARGGRGNAKLVGFSSNREAKVTIEDAIFDNLALAMLTGNSITTGAKTIDRYFEGTLSVTKTLTVPDTIIAIKSAHKLDYDAQTNLPPVAATFTGKVVTISALAEGDLVRVYYTAQTAATAKTVKVTADKFGGTFRLVVDVLVRDEFTGEDFFGQFIAQRAKIEDEFSFNFSPDGDPSVLNIPIEILKAPGSADMWELVIFGSVQ